MPGTGWRSVSANSIRPTARAKWRKPQLQQRDLMKIVVVGGTGLIGAAVVGKLQDLGHQAVAASRSTGVDITTGAGLAEALAGADIVIDTSNSRSDDPVEMVEFFRHAGRVLLGAAGRAGVKH